MIETWEPRVKILDIPVVGVQDEGTYYIKVQYTVPELRIER